MVMQIRKVLKELYPDRFGGARRPGEAPGKRLSGGLIGGMLKPAGVRFNRFKKRNLVYGIVAVLIISQALILAYYYNTFLNMQYNVDMAKAQVKVQLQHRKDVAASLNAIVVSYAKHEKGIFERGIDTRKEMVRPAPVGQAKDAQAPNAAPRFAIPGLSADVVLSKFLAVGESFPGLRLSENYQRLMDALLNAELKIAEQRTILNKNANEMVTAITTVPAVWYNKILRFKAPQFYIADADVDKPVKLEYAPR